MLLMRAFPFGDGVRCNPGVRVDAERVVVGVEGFVSNLAPV
jgi:hypothetical protein